MKRWSYIEPTSATDMTPVVITMSEDEILKEYYPFWEGQMLKLGRGGKISPEACIEDWVVVHWAEPCQDT